MKPPPTEVPKYRCVRFITQLFMNIQKICRHCFSWETLAFARIRKLRASKENHYILCFSFFISLKCSLSQSGIFSIICSAYDKASFPLCLVNILSKQASCYKTTYCHSSHFTAPKVMPYSVFLVWKVNTKSQKYQYFHMFVLNLAVPHYPNLTSLWSWSNKIFLLRWKHINIQEAQEPKQQNSPEVARYFTS